MAENKFVVKIIFHDENEDSVINEEYFTTREKAQSFKDLSDYAYNRQFGEGQTDVTTEIFEL